MDLDLLFIMVPIMAIPIASIIMAGKQKIAAANAEAERLRAEGSADGVTDELEEMKEEIGHLHAEMSEVQERLDFAERLLSQTKKSAELPPGPAEE